MPLVDSRTDTRTVRYIARCAVKGCGTVVSAAIPVTTTSATYALPTGGGHSTRRSSSHDLSAAPGWLRFSGYLVAPDRCGHGRMKVDAVRGTVTDHECDPRCEAATGPNCECSCGGTNHGAAHT